MFWTTEPVMPNVYCNATSCTIIFLSVIFGIDLFSLLSRHGSFALAYRETFTFFLCCISFASIVDIALEAYFRRGIGGIYLGVVME